MSDLEDTQGFEKMIEADIDEALDWELDQEIVIDFEE